MAVARHWPGTPAGAINIVAETLKAQYLMWPILLAILTGMSPRSVPYAAVAATFIVLLHPAAFPIFVALAMAAFALAIVDRPNRAPLLISGGVLAITGTTRFFILRSPYEVSEMSWDEHRAQWIASADLTVVAVLVIVALTALSLIGGRLNPSWTRWSSTVSAVLIGLAFVLLLPWVWDTASWWQGLEFRGPSLVVSLVLAGCAFVETWLAKVMGEIPKDADLAGRNVVMAVLAIGFSIAFSVQSIAFAKLTNRMTTVMSSSTSACVPFTALPGYPHTPLNLWSTSYHSIAMQSLQPEKIVLPPSDCFETALTGAVSPGALRGGPMLKRVDLSLINQESQDENACRATLGDGWWFFESTPDHTWRWTADTASITIESERAAVIHLRGRIDSLNSPNRIIIGLNGEVLETLSLSRDQTSIEIDIPLNVPAGTSTVTFASEAPGETVGGDPRSLAIAWRDPRLVPEGSTSTCLFQDFERRDVQEGT